MKSKVIIALCLLLALFVAGCSGTDEQAEQEEVSIEERTMVDYLERHNYSYNNVIYNDEIKTFSIMVDPYEITMDEGYYIAYDATNWLQEHEGGNKVVSTYIYDYESQEELVVAHYDPTFEEIEVEYK